MAVKTKAKTSASTAAPATKASSAVKLNAAQTNISSKGTRVNTPQKTKQDDPIGTGKVTCSALNVRNGAGANFTRIGGLTKGASFSVYEEKDGWLKIKYGSDYGWISKSYTDYKGKEPVTEPEKPKEEPKFEQFQAKVSGVSSLWMRSGPSTNYDTVTALSEGTVVTVVGQDPTTGWYQVKYGDKSGWMSNKYLEKVTGGNTNPDPKPPQGGTFEVVVTNCNNLNVRTGPNANYEQIGQLPVGTKVTVLEESGGWYRINYNGRDGWISGDYTYKPGEVSEAGQKAANKARELYTKYVAEGWTYSQTYRSSTGHYDCSYFTHCCWLAGGVNFNGTTAAGQAQKCYNAGGEISGKSNIQPGDLLFWANGSNGRFRNISHVAIAVGNGKRIDAGSTPVREDSVGSPMMIGRPSVLLK